MFSITVGDNIGQNEQTVTGSNAISFVLLSEVQNQIKN